MATVTIRRSDLMAALDAVKGAIPKKSFSTILTHVLFEQGNVWGFDSEIGVRAKLEGMGDMEFNVPFERFNNLMRSLNESEVTFSISGAKVMLTCGRHTSTVQQIVEDKFPKPPIPEITTWINVPTGFKEALEKALIAVSDREQEQVLSAVMIKGKQVVATDRAKLVRCSLETALQDEPILISKKAVSEIIRLGNPIKMAVHGAWSVWDYGNLSFFARLREGAAQFPPVDKLFEMLNPQAEELVPDGLVAILTRLKLFSEDKCFIVRDGMGKTELCAQGETSVATEEIDGMRVVTSKKFPCDALIAAAPYAEQMSWMATNQPVFMKGQNFEFIVSPVTAA